MATYTVMDVLARSLLNNPLPVSVQLSENLVVVVAFLLIAYTQSRRGHISIELLVGRLPERKRLIQQLIVLVLSLFVIAVVAWRSGVSGYEAWLAGDWVPTSGIRFPVWPAKLFVPFGLFLLSLQFLVDIYQTARQLLTTESKD